MQCLKPCDKKILIVNLPKTVWPVLSSMPINLTMSRKKRALIQTKRGEELGTNLLLEINQCFILEYDYIK